MQLCRQCRQPNQEACWRQHLRRFKRDYKRDRCELLSVRETRNDDVYALADEFVVSVYPHAMAPLATQALPKKSTRRRPEKARYDSERSGPTTSLQRQSY